MSAVESMDGKCEAFLQYKNRFLPSVKRDTAAFYPRAEDILIMAVILPPRPLLIPSAISLEKSR